MKNILLLLIFIPSLLWSQTYLHGTTGIQGERVTNCLVSTCSGTYLDNGGAGGNYSNSILGGLYRVFCPTIPGNCVRVTFNSFRTETGFDFLTIGNGATQNSPVFTTPPATVPNGRISGAPAVPFTYTANNPSGCLTFRFTSDGSITDAGWSASLSCVPCATPTNGPNITDNNDCSRATFICSDITTNVNARGPGLTAEGCVGTTCPAGGENHSNWYQFEILSSGTLRFTIDPQTNTDDYDFSIYGPNVTCGTLGTPLRCSDSGNTGNTGLNTTAVDNVESVTGDGFLAQMNVTAGQTYYLVVDEWLSNTGNGYQLLFGGTATLDCVLFPLELLSFNAEYRKDYKDVYLTWDVIVDDYIDGFIIEKSLDGINFDSIGIVNVTNLGKRYYDFNDNFPKPNGFTYYRLKWFEDGQMLYSDISAVAINDPKLNDVLIYTKDNNLILENFSVKGETFNLKIYNNMGQLVYSRPNIFLISNIEMLSLDNFGVGVYNIVVETDKNYTTYRFIKS